MLKEKAYKWPRVYVQDQLMHGHTIVADKNIAHYLRHVMRRSEDDFIRAFNGRDGEWQCALSFPDKKGLELTCTEQLREQPADERHIHFYFAPIKQARMDWMIEKAVELGATDFHPVITQNTEVRKLKDERIERQLTEAAEQCERLDIPVLHPFVTLQELCTNWNDGAKLYACLERYDAQPLNQFDFKNEKSIRFLIGPVGGFTDEEKDMLAAAPFTEAVDLGDTVLRCETAACMVLAALKILA